MKNYFLVVVGIVVLLALFGVIIPALISAKSTTSVLLGAAITLVVPVLIAAYVKLFKSQKQTNGGVN